MVATKNNYLKEYSFGKEDIKLGKCIIFWVGLHEQYSG